MLEWTGFIAAIFSVVNLFQTFEKDGPVSAGEYIAPLIVLALGIGALALDRWLDIREKEADRKNAPRKESKKASSEVPMWTSGPAVDPGPVSGMYTSTRGAPRKAGTPAADSMPADKKKL